MDAPPDERMQALPGWWTALASAAAAGSVFAVVFTVGMALSHDEQAGWGILLTLPVFVVSVPVAVGAIMWALRRRDRTARRRQLRTVALVTAVATVGTGAMVAWNHLAEHHDLERGRAVAPARDYVDEVADAYRIAARNHGLSGWDHVPAKEQWLLDLDGDGRVDRDAAPVAALPSDGIRIYDADRDRVVDAIEVVDGPEGTWCVDVRWHEPIDGFIEAFHEAREGGCGFPDGARVGG